MANDYQNDSEAISRGLILVADNDESFRAAFGQMLEIRGYETKAVGTIEAIYKAIAEREYDLLTLDLDWGMKEINGIEILKKAQAIDPLLPVIMITEYASIPTAVEAVRLGALNYIEKTLDREKTLITIRNAVETGKLKRQNIAYLSEIKKRYEIIGNSPAIKHMAQQIARAAATDAVVMITGESGTGKELVARQIHYNSTRRDKKFVFVDSGMLADSLAESELFGHRKGAFTGAIQDRKGLVEEAEGGTLFLDEIANASMALQAKLLHLIQEREFRRVGENELRKCNIRIIAATNQSLDLLAKEGKFRADLYYRLKVIELALPPLRERKEDIPLLAKHFVKVKSLKFFGREKEFAADAVNILIDNDWPGNIRELENCVERIVALSSGDKIESDEVKSLLGNMWLEKMTSLRSLGDMTREFRRECIIKAINLANGKIPRAAEILQIDRTHLYKLINEYQLKDFQ
jgi:two-component system nitrogen regulation response regulator NtrX